MVATGRVQIPFNKGGTYVALPADPGSFGKQAKPGTVYVEFDVPTTSISKSSDGRAFIDNPTSVTARLAEKKGLPIPEAPEFKNITLGGCK